MKIIITERQNRLLVENIPASLRRRINYDELKDSIEFIIQNYNPCDYGSSGDFIGEMCDIIVINLIEDYYEEGNDVSIDNKSKDDLYYFMVDTFADHLQDIYEKECG